MIKKRGEKRQGTYRGPDGLERTKSFKLKGEATKWVEDNRARIARGDWVDARTSRITVKDFSEPWLARQPRLAIRTRELYGYLLTRHIVPKLGDVPLGALRPSMVETWHTELAEVHPSTAAKAYRLLSQMMRAAIRDRILVFNPCQIPSGGREQAAERPVAKISEITALADAMPEHLGLLVLLAAWCQLRRGELLGLRRQDVDLLHGVLSVAVTRTKMMSGEMLVKSPKTEAGKRALTIPPHVLPSLVSHMERFVEGDPDALLFTGVLGGPLLVGVLDTAWHRARTKVGRTDLRLHDLRHTGLTLSAATGATIAELMKRAGHKSPSAALHYQHATQDRDRVLADALSELVPRAAILNAADFTRTQRAI